MRDFAIGDIQGCYDELMRLLDCIDFNERADRLWLVGDLVNRGKQSLEVLRFIKKLPNPARITLGNHDLHLLAEIFARKSKPAPGDSLYSVVTAPDKEALGHWLRKQAILIYDKKVNAVMCHAGIAPGWDLSEAMALACELEAVLSGDDFLPFLENMYGNEPNYWSQELTGIARLRAITNYFTRMRFCDSEGHLDLSYKGTLADAPPHLIPWYAVPHRKPIPADILFGHWAALGVKSPLPSIYALDSGCVWGGALTALCLQNRQFTSISCKKT
ncbi:MAG: symmetrical bis(5'-nucleosyl)-tetraphosphatase [Tatlockia sp.]